MASIKLRQKYSQEGLNLFSGYLPRAFPKSAHNERMYVPLEHVTRKIKFCLEASGQKVMSGSYISGI